MKYYGKALPLNKELYIYIIEHQMPTDLVKSRQLNFFVDFFF